MFCSVVITSPTKLPSFQIATSGIPARHTSLFGKLYLNRFQLRASLLKQIERATIGVLAAAMQLICIFLALPTTSSYIESTSSTSQSA